MIAKRREGALQSLGEEIANTITHGIGLILSFVAFYILVCNSLRKSSILCVISCSIYGGSLVTLYFTSTLYHACTHISMKKIMRKLDHISIYFLITGTYMPITLVALKGSLGWALFGLECGLFLVGILFKIFFGAKYGIVSVLFYLLMGSVLIFAIKPLFLALSFQGLLWVLLGGVFYILGIFFYATDQKFSYFHAIWHLFVLAGSICHFLVVLLYIIPLNAKSF